MNATSKTHQDVSQARDEFVRAMKDELAIWRGRLEGLFLQATLGKMDLEEKLRPEVARLEASYDKAVRYLHELARDEMSWDEIEPQLAAAMHDLAKEFDRAGEHFRIV